MKIVARSMVCIVVVLGVTARARAQQLSLPDVAVALDSTEGARLFDEAQAKLDFFALSEHFETQKTQAFCGVASAVIVLNALQVQAPDVAEWSPYRVYTQDNFFDDPTRKVMTPELVNRGGMTIDQLADLLRCHPANATVVHATTSSLDAFRQEAAKNLATAGDFMIVNWDRGAVGMDTMGHLSPLGAFDAKADKMLVMDVARYKYAPHWIDTPTLFRGMSTSDLSSDQSRGWVAVSRASTAPGPKGVKARNMFRFLLTLIAAAFALGALLGATIAALVTRARWKKKVRAA